MTNVPNKPKILCICRGGNIRSVSLKHTLNETGRYDALALGPEFNTPETCEMLYRWADIIIVASSELAKLIPQEWHVKLEVWHIGPDIWGTPWHENLRQTWRNILRAKKWI